MNKLILCIFSILVVSQLNAQDFAQWRGPHRDGIYNEKGLLKQWPAGGPKLLWHFDQLGDGHASVAVTKERIYTAGTSNGSGFVIALDNDGKTVWQTAYGKEWMENWEGVRSSPTVEGGKLFIISGYGLVVCMDATKGNILWKVDLMADYGGRNITWGFTENLLIVDNKLICTPGGTDANVIALDKTTGKLIWKSKGVGEKSAYGSPAIINYGGKKIIVAQTESHILGIDAEGGKLLWQHKFPNQWSVHPNTALFKNGQLFCSSGYGQGSVMLELSADASSVKELWSNKTFDCHLGGFVEIDGRIYGAGDASRKWICLDWKTGKELGTANFGKKGNLNKKE